MEEKEGEGEVAAKRVWYWGRERQRDRGCSKSFCDIWKPQTWGHSLTPGRGRVTVRVRD